MSKDDCIKAIENEFKELEDNGAWNQLYQKVRTEGTYNMSINMAKLAQNKNFNRYRDVLPYDHSRIVLQECTTDYINASLIKVESIDRNYILCQGPLSQTTPHFWLMIWQNNCKGIVMLNKVVEKNQIKCHQYWPLGEKRGGQDSTDFSTVDLRVDLVKEASHSHYVYRTFRLTDMKTKESREILHFHYMTWPDFGVPQSPEAFFKFLSIVRSSQCLEPKFGPTVVHCSAGIGRSGTFCLVDSVLMMLSKSLCNSEPGKILEVLLEMRRYRMGLIQTPDQLRFSYQAIIFGAHRMDETNGKRKCKSLSSLADQSEESSTSSEDVSHEEPPPLPPPRTYSLTRSMIEAEDSNEDTEEEDSALDDDQKRIINTGNYQRENSQDDLTETLGRPLPEVPISEPSTPTTTADVSSPAPPTADVSSPAPPTGEKQSNSCQNDVRRRREARIQEKVEEIKEKTRAAEDWQEKKQMLFRPLSVCAALLIMGLGGGLYCYFRMGES